MAWEHEKSGTTICLDIVRNLLILTATAYAVVLIWKWNWIVSLLAAVPIYVVMLNLIGVLTLPLYLFTPENRLKAKALKAFQSGDWEQGKLLNDEFVEKFNVNVPEELPTEEEESSNKMTGQRP